VEWVLKKVSESKRFRRDMEALNDRVFGMSIDDARAELQPLLDDPGKYRCTESKPNRAEKRQLSSFAPAVRGLLERYSLIEETRGDIQLGRVHLGESDHDSTYTRIGLGVDASEVVVVPGDETVFEIDGSDPADELPIGYPSVYHWMLIMARIAHPKLEAD
jgi:hypothetical protein